MIGLGAVLPAFQQACDQRDFNRIQLTWYKRRDRPARILEAQEASQRQMTSGAYFLLCVGDISKGRNEEKHGAPESYAVSVSQYGFLLTGIVLAIHPIHCNVLTETTPRTAFSCGS